MKKKCILLTVAFSIWFLTASCRENINYSNNIEEFANSFQDVGPDSRIESTKIVDIKYDYSFPSDLSHKDAFLSRPVRLAIDGIGFIYALDSRRNCIVKYSRRGDYISTIGRRGSGPGEFQVPNDFNISNDQIYVSDLGNYRIQQIDIGGIYQRTIKKYLTFYSMICNEEDLIYAAPLIYGKESPQIVVLNQSGEVVRAFGEPKIFMRDMITLNFVNLDRNLNGELLVTYRYLPIIRKYSKEGVLIGEINLSNSSMRNIETINMAKNSGRNISKKQSYVLNIGALRVFGNDLYILCQGRIPIILQYDFQGKQKEIILPKLNGQRIVKDFLVTRNEKGGKRFYLLQVYPENQIDVFDENVDPTKGEQS